MVIPLLYHPITFLSLPFIGTIKKIEEVSYISETIKPYSSFKASLFSNNNFVNVNRKPRNVQHVKYSLSKKKRWDVPEQVQKSFEIHKSEGKHVVQIVEISGEQKLRTRERFISIRDSNGNTTATNSSL